MSDATPKACKVCPSDNSDRGYCWGFSFFFGSIAMVLFLAGEFSISEIIEYLAIATTWEGISILTFLEGLLWTFFKHRVK